MSDRQRRGLEYELGLFYPSIATLAGRPATAILWDAPGPAFPSACR